MDSANERQKSFPIAITQMPITGNATNNGKVIRSLMREAAGKGARLVQFPEGALNLEPEQCRAAENALTNLL